MHDEATPTLQHMLSLTSSEQRQMQVGWNAWSIRNKWHILIISYSFTKKGETDLFTYTGILQAFFCGSEHETRISL